MNNILLPDKISFNDWLSDLGRTIPGTIIPSIPKNDNDWHKYAFLVISGNPITINGATLPTKLDFPKYEDWKRWAYFFITQNTN